eukprot:1168381-Lingulodinium_polyedra.AAC.1
MGTTLSTPTSSRTSVAESVTGQAQAMDAAVARQVKDAPAVEQEHVKIKVESPSYQALGTKLLQ